MTTIKINIDHSDNNEIVRANDLIQIHCFNKLQKQVAADLEKSKSVGHFNQESIVLNDGLNETYPSGSGLVYFIDGTRGAGKSTFLRSAYEGLAETNRLATLAYIDPSRIENNEIILLSVLRTLAEKIDSLLRQTTQLKNESEYKRFRDSFKKLAGGLALFAENYHQLQYLDAELFLDHGLKRAGHSKELRQHLHSLIDQACSMLKIDALLLAFDDGDTNSKHAMKVLECIRCYLDTPRLVVLVTGDIELYSLLVRDHFFNNLGHSPFDQGIERLEQRIRMIDHLEDQYLLKLFPIRRRLQLRPLWNLPGHQDNDYKLEYKSISYDLKQAINELIRRGLRVKMQGDINLYREFLLKQPLRSVLQVLSNLAPHITNESSSGGAPWSDGLSDSLRESLHGMALGSLYKFGINVDSIAANDLPALIDAVFELAVRDGDMDTAAYLRPRTNEDSLKNCFPALAADVAGLCARNPSAAIRYMLTGPGSVSLFAKILRQKDTNKEVKNIDQDILQRNFRKYMGIGRNEDSLNWARHATAVLTPRVGNSPSLCQFGIIGLHMRKPKGQLDKEFDDFQCIENAIAGLLKLDSAQAKKELPVIALSLMRVSGAGNRTYASIFNIIGLIAEVLELAPSLPDESTISRVLAKAYPTISISCPVWESESLIEEEADFTNDQGIGDSEDESLATYKGISQNLHTWLIDTEEARGSIKPSAVLLGKIWTRLYFSLENASNHNRGKMPTASLMEMFALCVINAFYEEETDYHLLESMAEKLPENNRYRTNPLSSPSDAYKKIAKIDSNTLPFTYLIATCPLILGLLNERKSSDQVNELLRRNTKAETQNSTSVQVEKTNKSVLASKNLLCNKVVWDTLEKTYIHGIKFVSTDSSSKKTKKQNERVNNVQAPTDQEGILNSGEPE